MTSYQKYLKSDHWKALRSKAIESAGRRCELCKHPHLLEVHHLTYRRLYDVTLADLMTLCAACHSRAHSWITWGEIVNGETSEQRRHILTVRFFGEMNRAKEIRRRVEPVPKAKLRRKERQLSSAERELSATRARTKRLALDFAQPLNPVSHEHGKAMLAKVRETLAKQFSASCNNALAL